MRYAGEEAEKEEKEEENEEENERDLSLDASCAGAHTTREIARNSNSRAEEKPRADGR